MNSRRQELEVVIFEREKDGRFGVLVVLVQQLWRGMRSNKATPNMMIDLLAE